MIVRELKDERGGSWQVWEVIPGSPRVSGTPTGQTPNVWGSGLRPDLLPPTPEEYDAGWLVFMGGTERRRLTPIPAGWLQMDDAQLLLLLDQASRGGVPD